MTTSISNAMKDSVPPHSIFLKGMSERSFRILMVFLALLIGSAVRLPYIFMDDVFPLGDGGLFMAMINAIKANHYLLPNVVHYNGFDIPFAYPPLGFYFVILTSRLLGVPTLTVVRFLPLAFNFLTIAFFVLLATEILEHRKEALLASIVFPVVFQVYQWTIRGGGITRSPGFLFFVATVYFICLYQKRSRAIYFVLAITCLSATVMSHLEWGLIAVVSVSIYLAASDIHHWRRNVMTLLLLGAGSFLLTSPWWWIMISRDGITPFLMASQVAGMTSGQFLDKLWSGALFSATVTVGGTYYLPWLAIFGTIVSSFRKNWFLPVWLFVTYIVAPKNAPISGIVPLVMLIAFALHSLDRYFLQLTELIHLDRNVVLAFLRRLVSLIPLSSIYLLVILSIVLTKLVNTPLIRPIKQSERAAMQFVAENTPPDSKFVVVTPYEWYGADAAEWFPFLADRQSMTTPQGLEWRSAVDFDRTADISFGLSALVRKEQSGLGSGEVVGYIEHQFDHFDYVAIFANNLDREFGGFAETGRYEIIYAKKDALIFIRKSPPN